MAHVLDPIVAIDLDGHEVRLGRLWADKTAILVFVRHFGCIFCKQQIADLLPLVDRIRAAGAEPVVIGNGTVEEARAFRDAERLAIPVLTDPGREASCAMQMRRGLSSVLTPSVVTRALRARRAGFRQTRVAGDPWQQGGVVVIAPGGIERFRFISRDAGDHPSPADILSAVGHAA